MTRLGEAFSFPNVVVDRAHLSSQQQRPSPYPPGLFQIPAAPSGKRNAKNVNASQVLAPTGEQRSLP